MHTYKDGPVIKGNRDGLIIYVDGRMEIAQVLESLERRIRAADDFFQDARASVKIMETEWTPTDTEPIRDLLSRFNITVEAILSGCNDENGVAEKDTVTPEEDILEKLQKDIYDLLEEEPKPESKAQADRIQEPAPEVPKNTSLQRRTLRSGQRIQYDGNVVIIGDVNPGAEITASGDILVFGSFRGVAHAGATGDENAVVAALKLQPTQLRIGNYISRAPDERTKPPNKPEIARIRAGNIEIESFLV
jgi:septum site-determining protein MinC